MIDNASVLKSLEICAASDSCIGCSFYDYTPGPYTSCKEQLIKCAYEAMQRLQETKRGSWLLVEFGFKCSECGAESYIAMPYCAVCGTKMDKKLKRREE